MILLRIALRNIAATKVRTLIIGILVTFGTMLVVTGSALLSTLEQSMARSIISSVSGHLQLFSSEARDSLEFFSAPTGAPDLGHITDFPRVKAVVLALPEVEAVVPMGSDFAIVFSGNIMDIKLEELRAAVAAGDTERARVLAEHIRNNVGLLAEQIGNLEGFVAQAADGDGVEEHRQVLEQAASEAFWADFFERFQEKLDYLENKVAWLAMDARMLFLRYIGTDTEAFRENFDLFELVRGEMIPAGRRGLLFPDFLYERMVKHQIAQRLDFIRENLESGRTIREDPKVASRVAQNVRQYNDILFQLDGPATREVTEALRELLAVDEADPGMLLRSFLDMDDGNFRERYDFFYERIAPRITLYQVPVGSTLTIRAFTRSGYATAVNVRVYGTYRFRGMEKSALAGVYCLMDLMTFRDLYGYITQAGRAELDSLKRQSGVEEIARDDAEEALFGEADSVVGEGERGGFDEFAGVNLRAGGMRFDDALMERQYTRDEVEGGIVINAAVRLKPGIPVGEGKAAVEGALRESGLALDVIDWRQASGLVGQFIGVVWIVLVSAIVIIFLVALTIINNSMVMATLDRTREIGTMRAIGAQRSYVLKMFFIESTVLGIGFGLLGVLLGSGLIFLLGRVGIPAVSDELYFLFAGSHLYPELLPTHLAAAFVVVFLVSLASTLYPARLAASIPPVRAMGKED